MHFPAFVITPDKPTRESLEEALAPTAHRREFDWWGLGGRFSGNIIPLDYADTVITGGDDIPDMELALMTMVEKTGDGVEMKRSARRGAGVDAARLDNIKGFDAGPIAVVVDKEWLNCPIFPVGPMLRALGGRDDRPEAERLEEERAMNDWNRKVDKILNAQPGSSWLSIVDCHV
jgi:hypothetical protein